MLLLHVFHTRSRAPLPLPILAVTVEIRNKLSTWSSSSTAVVAVFEANYAHTEEPTDRDERSL